MDTPTDERKHDWLLQYAADVTSSRGEDGIIAKVLEVLGSNDRWCVEFGAWDGKSYSNTYNLITNKGYSAVLIEAHAGRFQELQDRYKLNKKVIGINVYVGFDEHNGLDVLLKDTPIPVDFDLLSIDIDGNDYYVWEAVRKYRPKVVIVEYNPSIPNQVEFVQARDMNICQGASLRAIEKLGRQKGYELVCATEWNGIFVDAKYFAAFGIKDNSINALRTTEPQASYIFSGFDGTIFIRGYRQMPWHNVPYKESRLQQLPKFLRDYPANFGNLRKLLLDIYRYLIQRNII